jgi:hypothetical protein
MTSFLIWKELLPTNDNCAHLFPIPQCSMLIPLEHSVWNDSKGGSDTVTRFTYNSQIIVPVKSPQNAVCARFFSLFLVPFHRGSQVVTCTKQPNIDEDTIKSIRDRNNKRLPFHKSLNYVSQRLLENSRNAPSSEEDSNLENAEFAQRPAPRFKFQPSKQKGSLRCRPFSFRIERDNWCYSDRSRDHQEPKEAQHETTCI